MAIMVALKLLASPVALHIELVSLAKGVMIRFQLLRLLQRDPSKRPSATEALEHAWLANPPEYCAHVPSSTIVQRLADFTRMTRLQVQSCWHA